jgi:hypothetical protein
VTKADEDELISALEAHICATQSRRFLLQEAPNDGIALGHALHADRQRCIGGFETPRINLGVMRPLRQHKLRIEG